MSLIPHCRKNNNLLQVFRNESDNLFHKIFSYLFFKDFTSCEYLVTSNVDAEADKKYKELDGLKKRDFNVKNYIKNYLCVKRSYYSFQRGIPTSADCDKVNAFGILETSIPKK